MSLCRSVGSGVLPQRPADALADEEFLVGGIVQAVAQQPLGIGLDLVGKLVDEGAAAQPEVLVAAPAAHLGFELWEAQHQRPHQAAGEHIHAVPPGLLCEKFFSRREAGRQGVAVGCEQLAGGVREFAFWQRPQQAGCL